MPSPIRFDWNDLSFFLAVARAGRLTVAAKRLGVDHTTAGRRIAALEAALETQLFTRTTLGYALTPSGERLLAAAEGMESIAGSIRESVGGADLTVSGTVRIGAPDGFGNVFLAPRLGALSARHPGLEIELIAMPRVFSLSKREADIAIALEKPQGGRLRTRKLCDYELGVYASKSYLARTPAIRRRADMTTHPFIGYAEDFIFTPELDYIPQLAKDIRPAIRSSSIVAQCQAAVGGAGLCVLPCFMAAQQPALVRLLGEELSLLRSFWLVTHADLRGLARVRATADFIFGEAQAAISLFAPGSAPGGSWSDAADELLGLDQADD